MKKFIMPRQTGKTYNLILESAETGVTIIVPVEHMKDYVKKMAQRMNKSIPTPITIQEFITKEICCHRNPNGYLIDELDSCLSSMNIKGYSTSDMSNIYQRHDGKSLSNSFTYTCPICSTSQGIDWGKTADASINTNVEI